MTLSVETWARSTVISAPSTGGWPGRRSWPRKVTFASLASPVGRFGAQHLDAVADVDVAGRDVEHVEQLGGRVVGRAAREADDGRERQRQRGQEGQRSGGARGAEGGSGHGCPRL